MGIHPGACSVRRGSFDTYSVISDFEILIWAVTPSGDLYFRSVDIKKVLSDESVTVQKLVSGIIVRDQNGMKNSCSCDKHTLRQLYDVLVEPVENCLDSCRSWVISPEGLLFGVPFCALLDKSGCYVIENHVVRMTPSMSVLSAIKSSQSAALPPTTGLVFANPEADPCCEFSSVIPHVLTEADAVVDALSKADVSTTLVVGGKSSREDLTSGLVSKGLVHIACHGGGAGSLSIGKNVRPLTVEEVASLQLRCGLVVLSSCSSARGGICRDGITGLPRAFVKAGAPAVLASLWPVGDEATCSFMSYFYNEAAVKYEWAEAVRFAMLESKKERPDPVFWAPFVLTGVSQPKFGVLGSGSAKLVKRYNSEQLNAIEDVRWDEDETTEWCNECLVRFNLCIRRHHCRRCGAIFCGNCSSNRCLLPSRGNGDGKNPLRNVRVCWRCFRLSYEWKSGGKRISPAKNAERLDAWLSRVGFVGNSEDLARAQNS